MWRSMSFDFFYKPKPMTKPSKKMQLEVINIPVTASKNSSSLLIFYSQGRLVVPERCWTSSTWSWWYPLTICSRGRPVSSSLCRFTNCHSRLSTGQCSEKGPDSLMIIMVDKVDVWQTRRFNVLFSVAWGKWVTCRSGNSKNWLVLSFN